MKRFLSLLTSGIVTVITLQLPSIAFAAPAYDNLAAGNPASDNPDTNSNNSSSLSDDQFYAIRYACMFDDLIRRVEIDYFLPEVNVPCQVNYFKDVEAPGEIKTLWSSESYEGYCEEQAFKFVKQLEKWGWNCQPQE